MRRIALVVPALLLASVSIGCAHDLDELEPFPCATNGLCPEGYACVDGRCRQGGNGTPDASNQQPDGSIDSGVSDVDAGRDAGESSEDAGHGSDGGTVDAGAPDAGYPSGPLAWGQMELPSGLNPLPKLWAVHGLSAGLVYAVGENGTILRYANGEWRLAFREPSGLLLRSVYVTSDGDVLTAGEGALVRCKSGCDSSSNYSTFRPTGTNSDAFKINKVCGSGARAFAVGEEDGSGVVYEYDRAAVPPWRKRLSDSSQIFRSCWIAPDGAVFLTSRSTDIYATYQVLRWESAMTPETIDYVGVDPTLMFFNVVWGDADEVFIAGSRKNIFSRDPASSTWAPVFTPNNMGEIWSMAGDGVEVYAGGYMFSFDSGYQLVARRNGRWDFCESPPPINIAGLWSASPRAYFAVGWGEDGGGRIYLGSR
jgi:hypothetical protein